MLVLDANILIRAVLGVRVSSIIHKFAPKTALLAPVSAFEEARYSLPRIVQRRNMPVLTAMAALESLEVLVHPVELRTFAAFELVARQLIRVRDEKDWPVLASALALGCPIWTEDTDFFGCGVATWTTDRVERFLDATSEP